MQTAASKFTALRSYRVATRPKSFNLRNMRSIALRFRQRNGEIQFVHLRFAFGGMFGMARQPRVSVDRCGKIFKN